MKNFQDQRVLEFVRAFSVQLILSDTTEFDRKWDNIPIAMGANQLLLNERSLKFLQLIFQSFIIYINCLIIALKLKLSAV